MTDYKTVTGTHKGARTEREVKAPITALRQKYVSPAGRHSQKTHGDESARGAEAGCTTERELYVVDRDNLRAKLSSKSNQATQQKEQNEKAAIARGKPQAEIKPPA